MKVEIASANPTDKIFYWINNNSSAKPKPNDFKAYTEPFFINATTEVWAKIKGGNRMSKAVSAKFFKKPNNYTIEIKSKYNPQYHAGGSEGLLDGINGTENWRKGDWQGYQSQDFEAIINLQGEKSVSECNGTFLQDSRSWILMPTKVEYYVSDDNVHFSLIGSIDNTLDPKETENKIQNFSLKLAKATKAKYVKVKAYNFGKLPEWHQGAGGDAFIFVDEITIK